MSDVKNRLALIEILGLDNDTKIERSLLLQEFTWDSMAMVMLQTFIDTEFNKQIDPDQLPEFQNIGEIDDFIQSFKP